MLKQSKGLSLILVLVIVLFISVPALFWFLSSRSSKTDVRGVSSIADINGVVVYVSSKSSTWELNGYACETKDDCLSSLTSGVKVNSISGGVSNKYEVILNNLSDWDNYSYLKLYVKSGWGSSLRVFNVSVSGEISSASIESVSDGNYSYDVAIIPLEAIRSGSFSVVSFSN